LNSSDPSAIAYFKGLPARLPDFLEKRGQVTNGEEDVTVRTVSCAQKISTPENSPFEAQTSTWEDSIFEIPADGTEGIFLHHGPDLSQFFPGLLIVHTGIEFHLLKQREIRPVDIIFGVGIIGVHE
jgi:hypothetical protein